MHSNVKGCATKFVPLLLQTPPPKKNKCGCNVLTLLLTVCVQYTHSGKKVEVAVKKIVNGEDVKVRSAYVNPDSLDLYYNIPQLLNY